MHAEILKNAEYALNSVGEINNFLGESAVSISLKLTYYM